jgi:uncharacterized protein
MLQNIITTVVDASRRFALVVTLIMLALTAASGWFITTHFKINTDVNSLLAADLGRSSGRKTGGSLKITE